MSLDVLYYVTLVLGVVLYHYKKDHIDAWDLVRFFIVSGLFTMHGMALALKSFECAN